MQKLDLGVQLIPPPTLYCAVLLSLLELLVDIPGLLESGLAASGECKAAPLSLWQRVAQVNTACKLFILPACAPCVQID